MRRPERLSAPSAAEVSARSTAHSPARKAANALALTAGLATAIWPLTVMSVLAGEGPVTPGPVFTPKITVDPGPVFVPPATGGKAAGYADNDTAAKIVADVNLAVEYCGWVQKKEYVVDCLSDELNRVAEAIPSKGAYGPAKTALKKASKDLYALVTENQSATLRPGIARVTNSIEVHTSSRPLRAVETARLPDVAQEAIGIIQDTGTILLRSSTSSEESANFTAISAAVNSSTILLRSL